MAPKLKFTIITLFKEALEPYLNSSMMYKAQEKGLVQFNFVNLRDFGLGPHKSVDDTPYGGGDGMLLRPEPVFAAVESIKAKDRTAKVILPTPAGDPWTQQMANALLSGNMPTASSASAADTPLSNDPPTATDTANIPHYIIICPHYEGYDERILSLVDYKISLGNYILTGGELPALVIIDSITRLVPGVLGGATSAAVESFSDGDNIEYPQYTKPADFRGLKVPDVLLSGHHERIAAWRAEHAKKAKK